MTVAEHPGILGADEAAWLDGVLDKLAEPLDPKLGNMLKEGGAKGAVYIESYVIIQHANDLFGVQNWGYEVKEHGFHPVGTKGAGVFWARVTVTIKGFTPCTDIGTCDMIVGADKSGPVNSQVEMAMKGAASRGIARALRAKGDQFGLSLYEKDSDIQEQIRAAVKEQDQAKARGAVRPAQHPQQQGRPAQPQQQTKAPTTTTLPRSVAPKTRERALASEYWVRSYKRVRELLKECGHANDLDKWAAVRSYITTEIDQVYPAILWEVSIDDWAFVMRKLKDKLGIADEAVPARPTGPTPADAEAHYNRLLQAAHLADDEAALVKLHDAEGGTGEADTLHATGVLSKEQYDDVTAAVIERFDFLNDHPI